MPARPTPNLLSAPRRVVDWAMLLVSSSNLVFMFFLRFEFCLRHLLIGRKKMLVTLFWSTCVKAETKSFPALAKP
jgi:hypothetical protein